MSNIDMQPPPAKRQRVHNYDRRPRLSICPSVSPDPELVEDRDRNDNTLKGKFEAIFDKYGHDFSDIGDEINVMTGEVMVDNGHILSMRDEKDPGSPSRARPRVSREPTESRLMGTTHSSRRSLTVGPEDVVASIEAMARRVATGHTPYPEEEDEIEEGCGTENMVLYHQRSGSLSSDSLLGIGDDDYQDEWGTQRSGSPDSLLGCEKQGSSIESLYEENVVNRRVPMRKSNPKDEPVVLTSEDLGPAPAAVSGPNVFESMPTSFHGHPTSATPRPPSPHVYVKSNGKQKVVAKKFHVSNAYEELQRQASLDPAAVTSQQVSVSKTGSSWTPALDTTSSETAEPASQSHNTSSNTVLLQNDKAVLQRLPIARPSNEPKGLGEDYESDDPLQ